MNRVETARHCFPRELNKQPCLDALCPHQPLLPSIFRDEESTDEENVVNPNKIENVSNKTDSKQNVLNCLGIRRLTREKTAYFHFRKQPKKIEENKEINLKSESFNNKTGVTTLNILGDSKAMQTNTIKTEQQLHSNIKKTAEETKKLEKVTSEDTEAIGKINEETQVELDKNYCLTLLQQRLHKVVEDFKTEGFLDGVDKNKLRAIEKQNEIAQESPNLNTSKISYTRSKRLNGATSSKDYLTSEEKRKLKDVLRDILQKKVIEEKDRNAKSNSSQEKSYSGHATMGSSVTSDILKESKNDKEKSQAKLYNKKKHGMQKLSKPTTSMTDEISGGDTLDKKKTPQKKKTTKILSTSSFKPSAPLNQPTTNREDKTADWIMKQKFEKYRKRRSVLT